MTKLRLVLLATTALTAMQCASLPSHAQTAPQVMAQAKEELGPDGKPKREAPKGAPPAAAPKAAPPAAPPAAAPPPRPTPPPAPPAAAPPRPAPPPPPAAPKAPTPPSAGQPKEQFRERERTGPPPGQTPPPAAAPQAQPAPATPPAGQPKEQLRERERTTPTPGQTPPAGAPKAQPEPATPPAGQPKEQLREREKTGPAPGQTPPPAAAPQAQPAPTPPAGGGAGTPPTGRPGGQPPTGAPPAPNAIPAPAAPSGQQGAAPSGAAPLARRAPPTVTTPLPPPPPPAQALAPAPQGAAPQGPRRMEDFRGQRQESDQGGRRVFTEPGRVIVVDPSGQSFIRHNEEDRFRFGARDIQTQQVGGETRTVVIRPDGSQVITVVGRDGQLLRRLRRDREGREIIIIDNSYRDPRAVGGFYVDLPPPVIRIPYDRYIVEADVAPPELIYDTMLAPPVDRIDRRYSLDEIRYSPSVRQLMPSIDLNTINFETGSWEIPPDQAAKLQVIADGLNRAIQRNPREVFLIEGHTDAVGNDVDNLSLSDRRAESAAELLTQQFQVPAENLTSQGYGSQYPKEQTSGPSRINRRVTIRRITPLLNGGTASLPPPPPGTAPPR
ncbi:MAG: OmpA family protein [Alphaproteobacteria bacterium]|nr:MAG: OmpA family protein [Alphaproteobacteria bacterium]